MEGRQEHEKAIDADFHKHQEDIDRLCAAYHALACRTRDTFVRSAFTKEERASLLLKKVLCGT
eukprot:4585351-Pyramimonas_sp.AAC.2